jgi:hypothetical protein
MIPTARQCAAAMKSTKAVRTAAAALLLVACATVASALSSAPAFGLSQQQCYQETGSGEEVPNGQCHPGWEVWSNTRPTHIEPGAKGLVEFAVFNVGGGVPTGKVTLTDVLPPGVTAIKAGQDYFSFGLGDFGLQHEITGRHSYAEEDPWECTGTTTVTCTAEPGSATFPLAGGGAGAGHPMNVGILVEVADGTTEGALPNDVTVVGGGAPTPASTSQPITVSSKPAGFGVATWNAWFSNKDGTIDTQAGSHPYAATFAFELNTRRARGFTFKEEVPETEEEYLNREGPAHAESDLKAAGGSVESLVASLPPGLFADVHALPQCTRRELNVTSCPPQSQIGILDVYDIEGADFGYQIYNMVAPAGSPAEFGFAYEGIDVFLASTVRTGSDYSVKTTTAHIPQRDVEGAVLTLWGYPADRTHDAWRNGNPAGCGSQLGVPCHIPSELPLVTGVAAKPFFTLPTDCAGPPQFSLSANTWQDPSHFAEANDVMHTAGNVPSGITGCGAMAFNPSIMIAPDTSSADTPAGLTAEVTPSVGGLSELEGRSTADIENTNVVLPPGVAINPGQAAGLQACQPPQSAIGTEAPAACPAASKVGTFSIETPLLTQHFEGNIYVLQSNPPTVELLLAGSSEGVNLKLVGKVHLDETTGQLVTTFAKTPELPFTEFKLSFSGGARAALVTPAQCGNYTSVADFTPWSSPFTSDVLDEPTFAIASGAGGSPCPPSSLPFAPSLIAGSTTDHAGSFTDFSLLLQRGDGQQRINGLRFKAPAGLTGALANVPLCTNAQAETNTCPEASKIGHTVVESGPGPYPLVVPEPGKGPAPIYLTESYEGAPFGLSIVVPLQVGPFTLPTQRVRAKIEVDPTTAQLTVTTDPLPQMVAGVPTDLREIDAVIERPEFMINPTNCDPREFSGTAYGTPAPGESGPHAAASISSRFQVGSCRELAFTPSLTTTTPARSSKLNGAALSFKIAYPKGAMGKQSWFREAKFDLPKQLPARLTTIQQACLAATFEHERSHCPAHSVIGRAVVRTPVLPVPLEGNVYFVSYGGAAFPDVVLVLDGDNVHIELHGNTFIDGKTGVTTATFKNTPDVPFESIEVTLPAGPFSEFGTNLPANANYDFCGQKLMMPTSFKAQNGLEIRQNTRVSVTGCPTTVSVRAHTVKGKTLTVTVYAPAAGKFTATGKGLSKATKAAKGIELLTVTLHAKRTRKFTTRLKLTFKPTNGRTQTASARLVA